MRMRAASITAMITANQFLDVLPMRQNWQCVRNPTRLFGVQVLEAGSSSEAGDLYGSSFTR